MDYCASSSIPQGFKTSIFAGNSVVIRLQDGSNCITYFLDADVAVLQKEQLLNRSENSSMLLQVRGRTLAEAVQLRTLCSEQRKEDPQT